MPQIAVKRVILVDDHTLFRAALGKLLKEEGIQVVAQATSACEARSLLRSTPCDVAIVDAELPDGSGLDVIDQLQRLGVRSPVLVLSMHTDTARVRAAMAAGARGYLSKAADPKQLLSALRTVARGERFLEPEVERRVLPLDQVDLTVEDLMVRDLALARYSNPEMSSQTGLSLGKVKACLRRLYTHYGVQSRSELLVTTALQGVVSSLPPKRN